MVGGKAGHEVKLRFTADRPSEAARLQMKRCAYQDIVTRDVCHTAREFDCADAVGLG
jgi:hypothetical protein